MSKQKPLQPARVNPYTIREGSRIPSRHLELIGSIQHLEASLDAIERKLDGLEHAARTIADILREISDSLTMKG